MGRTLVVVVFGMLACGPAASDQEDDGSGASGSRITVIAECDDPCPGIELERVAVLGSPDDSVLLNWHSPLVAGDSLLAAGRINEAGVVPLYDLRGRQVKVVGRYGGGPGELRGPRPTPGPDGRIWILDLGNQRLSVLGSDGDVARETPLYGGPRSAVPTGPDRVLVRGFLVRDSLDASAYRTPTPTAGGDDPPRPVQRASPEAAPAPFHVVDSMGEIVTSFGTWPGFGQGAEPPVAAVVDDSTILASIPGRYALEQITVEGEVVGVLARRVAWFEPHDRLGGPGAGPMVSAMRVRSDTLWVRIYLPTEHRFEPGEPIDLAAVDRTGDVMIEVIDLGIPEVVARQQFDDITLRFIEGSDLLYSARQDDMGYVTMDLWRARIAARP